MDSLKKPTSFPSFVTLTLHLSCSLLLVVLATSPANEGLYRFSQCIPSLRALVAIASLSALDAIHLGMLCIIPFVRCGLTHVLLLYIKHGSCFLENMKHKFNFVLFCSLYIFLFLFLQLLCM